MSFASGSASANAGPDAPSHKHALFDRVVEVYRGLLYYTDRFSGTEGYSAIGRVSYSGEIDFRRGQYLRVSIDRAGDRYSFRTDFVTWTIQRPNHVSEVVSSGEEWLTVLQGVDPGSAAATIAALLLQAEPGMYGDFSTELRKERDVELVDGRAIILVSRAARHVTRFVLDADSLLIRGYHFEFEGRAARLEARALHSIVRYARQ